MKVSNIFAVLALVTLGIMCQNGVAKPVDADIILTVRHCGHGFTHQYTIKVGPKTTLKEIKDQVAPAVARAIGRKVEQLERLGGIDIFENGNWIKGNDNKTADSIGGSLLIKIHGDQCMI
jgi:hypothetical protein